MSSRTTNYFLGKSLIVGLTLLLVTGLISSCGGTTVFPDPPPIHTSSVIPIEPALLVQAGCRSARFAFQQDLGVTCPSPRAGWQCVKQDGAMIDCGSNRENYLYELPGKYRVCAYQWPHPSERDVETIRIGPKPPGLTGGSDCAAVFPAPASAGEYEVIPVHNTFMYRKGVGDQLLQSFYQGAGLPANPQSPGSPKVKVAVIDSVRTSDFSYGGSPGRLGLGKSIHGRIVGGIIEAVALGNYSRNVDTANLTISQYQVLSYMPGEKPLLMSKPPEGGTKGIVSDVASAIVQAAREGAQIINISLGWDSSKPDDQGLQLVKDALEWASCKQKALIFAAAGNASGPHSIVDQLTYPARFQDAPTCDDDPSHPIVVAIGSVDHAGRPLHTSRAQAEPQLVAPGLGGTIEDGIDRVSTSKAYYNRESGERFIPKALSGSSISTAVASGIAAAIMLRTTKEEDRKASSVLTKMMENSVRLDRAAKKPLDSIEPKVRFLTLTGILEGKDINVDGSEGGIWELMQETPSDINCKHEHPVWNRIGCGTGELVDPTPTPTICGHCEVIQPIDPAGNVEAVIYAASSFPENMHVQNVRVILTDRLGNTSVTPLAGISLLPLSSITELAAGNGGVARLPSTGTEIVQAAYVFDYTLDPDQKVLTQLEDIVISSP